ncbi:MAG: glycosyltransferase family 9 protein [Oligoflexia bacterium]|nr:glycosyltransferase family 9 protein [Oligoflexia bacterium]
MIVHLEALGAVLRGTAILPAIKRKYPKAHITWITHPRAAELLHHNPLIDRVLKNDHQGALQLRTLAFDETFVIDKSLEAAGLSQISIDTGVLRGFKVDPASGAILPAQPEAQELYELGLNNHKKFFVNQKSEVQLITEALGLPYARDPYVFNFSAQEKASIDGIRKQLQLKKNVIGLNLGCSPTIPYKKLNFNGWCQVIDELIMQTDHDASILLLGGPEDSEVMAKLYQSYANSVIPTSTHQGLREGMKCVELCNVIITGDSLGMHMAIALKKSVVAWFGPTCAQEIDLYDRGVKILSQAECGPCWKRNCSQDPMCYDFVPFTALVEAACASLKTKVLQASPVDSSQLPTVDLE